MGLLQLRFWGGAGGGSEQPNSCQSFILLQCHPHLPGYESSAWLAVFTLSAQVTGHRPRARATLSPPQAPVPLSGKRVSLLPLSVYILDRWAQRWDPEVPMLGQAGWYSAS